jgi:branched-chain amino acid transport system substrate-binding protein
VTSPLSDTRAALLVGCSSYEDPAFLPLEPPVQDINMLTRVLINQEIGDFTVNTLLHRPSGVVREQIEGFFANRKPNDLLLLYFSCHGVRDSSGQLHFVAANTKKERLGATGISARWVKEQMDQSRSQRIVLLLDCCYSGAFGKGHTRGGASAEETSTKKIVEQLGGHGRVVITASDTMEYAYDSEFTDAVVEGLETGAADLDGDGHVSVSELYRYVYDQVHQNKPNQTPTMSADGMRGELYLAKNPHAALPLPDKLEQALESKDSWDRQWAVSGVRLLLDGDHREGQKRTARRALVHLRDHDTELAVRAAASDVLDRVCRPPDVSDPPRQFDRRLVWGSLVLVAGLVLGATLQPSLARLLTNTAHADKPPFACSPSVKPADGVLSFGTLFPKTGAFVYTGPALDTGARLAIKEINDAGSVPGMTVKLDEANQRDEGNPATGTAGQSADALLAGGVDAIIGPGTSAAALNVIGKTVCAGVIMFSPSNTSPVFTTYPDHGLYFRTAPSGALEGHVLGKLVADDGNSTAVVMSRDDSYGNHLRETTERTIRESGRRVLDSFHYNPDAPEYDKDVQRVKTQNPDAIVLVGFTENAQIIAKMIEKGIGPKSKRVYVVDASVTNTLAGQVSPRDPGAVAGIKGTSLYAGDEEFAKRLREINHGLRDLTYAAQAYDAVVITALAAAAAGTDEPAAVAKEINGVTKTGVTCTSFASCLTLVKDHRDIAYVGPSGPLEFSDPGEPRCATYVISEIQTDGTVKPLRNEMMCI